jgi:phosphoribosylanthranilate isomerase
MIIKASRITNLTDARYFAAKDVGFLGFNLESGTEGFLEPIYMKAIREWVQGPAIVGEFSASPTAEIREAALFYGLDAVQVTERQLPELDLLEGISVILHLQTDGKPENTSALLAQVKGKFQYALLDFSSANMHWADLQHNLSAWQQLAREYPLLLHLDVQPESLQEIMAALPIAGFSFTGGEEEKVGVKSYEDIDEIFDVLS